MKIKPGFALCIGGVFAVTVAAAPYTHDQDQLHLPPGNAPLVMAFATVASTASWSMSVSLHNAIHDADYVLPANTKPLKSDGQAENS
jgi:hypothetical protein